jgi:MoaA/NifB/PqqE/SkfB family radical SAM enzyme
LGNLQEIHKIIKQIDKSKLSRRAWLHLGTLCNAKCDFCYYKNNLTKKNDVEELKRRIAKYKDLGFKIIELSGGEPTVFPYFYELIQYIKENDLDYSFTTNGSTDIRDLPVEPDLVTFSLHSLENNKILHLSSSNNEKLIKNIEWCEKNEITYRINTVILENEIKNLEEVIDFVNSLKGCKQHNFIWLASWGDEEHFYSKEILKIFDVIKKSNRYVLRYVPFCYLPEELIEKNMNYIQQQHDYYDWNINAYYLNKWNDLWNMGNHIAHRREKDFSKNECPKDCRFYNICDGYQGEKLV